MTRGVFTISLDTELGWGSFDKGSLDRHETAYRNTPAVVDRLCTLFDRYDVSATWAFVAHLFDDCGGAHPDLEAASEWYGQLPCMRDADRTLWYAPDLFETVRECSPPQEVGLHGYSHLVFADHDRATADRELAAAVEAAARHGVDPVSFVFPRNRIAHASLLADHDFEVYRGVNDRWYERPGVPERGRKPLRFAAEALATTPPVVTPVERDGVVCVPGSQVFRPDHGGWGLTPDGTQVTRATKGLERAATTGGVFHLWCHPFNLARNPADLLAKFGTILERAAALRADGRLDVAPLRAVAADYRGGRWDGTESTPTKPSDEKGASS